MKRMLLATGLIFASGLASFTRAQAPAEGAIDAVEVMRTTATVEKLDIEKRKVTLRLEDGASKTMKVDKRVKNLDQVKVGDHLKLAYAEEIAIIVSNDGAQPQASGSAQISVAPKGAKPAAVEVETVSMTGEVLAVDAQKHRVTLREADGTKKTIKVSKKIQNLDRLKVGESVSIMITEALAVEIVK